MPILLSIYMAHRKWKPKDGKENVVSIIFTKKFNTLTFYP